MMSSPETDAALGTPPQDRTVIFLTNNRTASGFLRQALIEEYGIENIFMFGLTPDPKTGERRGTMEQLRDVAPTGRFRLYYGHLPYGIHALMPGPVEYAVTIRDPVERVLSLYDAEVLQRRSNPPPLKDWLRAKPDARDGMVKRMNGFDNWTEKHRFYDFVADRPLDAEPEATEAHLETAIERTGGDTLILPQNHPGEKLALLQRHYGTAPLFSLHFQNTGTLSRTPRRDACTFAERSAVEACNRLDLAYYEWAMAEFDRRLDDGLRAEGRIMDLVCDVVRDPDADWLDDERLFQRLNGFVQLKQKVAHDDLIEVLKRFVLKRNLNPAIRASLEDAITQLSGAPAP